MYYSNTRLFLGQLMLDLSTFCIASAFFFLILFVLLNKTHTFAVYYYNTRNKSLIYNIATMKATIVKNDKFETVGFEVKNENNTVFSWGISPNGMYFVKDVSFSTWANDIFELVSLNAVLREQSNFISKAFDHVISKNVSDVRLKDNKAEIEATKKKIEAIISKII